MCKQGEGRGTPTLTKSGIEGPQKRSCIRHPSVWQWRGGGERRSLSSSYKGSRYDNQTTTSFDDPNRWNARYSLRLCLSEPFTEILGGSDVFIDQHSTINLTCIVHTPDKPAHVFWLRNGKVRLTRQPASFTMKNSKAGFDIRATF